MARPAKLNADYFSHDVDMRNDIRIRGLRRQFGHEGFAIYIMLLETLANCDYFEYKWDENSIELLSYDYDIDSKKLKEILAFLIKLDLIQTDKKFIFCKSLDKRLSETLIKKRDGFSWENAKRNEFPSQ
jgi:hypothetical protein